MSKKVRKGAGFSWLEEAKHSYKGSEMLRSTYGFTVDNLDTKAISETENIYEEVFVRMRQLLEDKPWCCDNREDVLSICQAISDSLRENLLIAKD